MNTDRKVIVYLIIDYVPHQITSINGVLEDNNNNIYSFSISEQHPYIPDNINRLSTFRAIVYTRNQLLDKIVKLSPILIVTAGWMISDYIWVCKRIKSELNIPIVAMSDTQWYGTWRQRINVLLSPFHVKRAFTHLWVAGIRQYEYARRL